MFFAFASTTSRVYDNKVVPYSLASLALLYDIRGHNHWVSELVAGAVIGNFIGKVVYENHHANREKTLSKRKNNSFAPTYNWSLGNCFGSAVPTLTVNW
jgi:hypothetical protein